MELRRAVSVLIASLGSAAATAALALETAVENRIEVSGTRAPGTAVALAGMPLVVVTAEQIAAGGFTSVGDVLRTRHLSDALGLSNVTTMVGPGDGTHTASLRGLGASRTLVLVNGRRWPTLAGGQVDLSPIPIALVQRIEILGEGASAIHGSDAVAGVINIVLRRDYDGLEADLAVGANVEGDGAHRGYGVTLGAIGDRRGATLNLYKSEQGPIWAGDRTISRTPIAHIPQAAGSAFGEYGVIDVPGVGLRCLSPTADQSLTDPAARTPQDFVPFTDACRYNFAPAQHLLAPSDRLTAYASAHQRVGERASAFVEATYSQRKSETAFAPASLLLGFSAPVWNIPVSAQNLWNPFGMDLHAVGIRLPGAFRVARHDVDTYHVTVGIEGTATLFANPVWWDAHASRGEMSRSGINERVPNAARVALAVGPSHIDPVTGMPVCTGVTAPCVPLNLFSGSGGITQEMLDFITFDAVSGSTSGLQAVAANVSGEAGPVAYAVGAEWRRDTFSDAPDSMFAAGLAGVRQIPGAGERSVREAYLELGVPLVRDRVEASAAFRTSRYEQEGTFGDARVARGFDHDAWSVGVTWRALETVVLRAGRSDVFRAPSLTNLFGGTAESMGGIEDPCEPRAVGLFSYGGLTPEQRARCHAQGVPEGGAPPSGPLVRTHTAGNPWLSPEQGHSTSFGMTWRPRIVRDLELSVDHWRVELDDALSVPGAQVMLRRCVLEGIEEFCPPEDPNRFFTRDPAGALTLVRGASFNLAHVRVSGVDVSGTYRLDTAAAGSLQFRVDATWTREALASVADGAPAENRAGRALGVFGGPTWRWRGNGSLDWYLGGFGVTWTTRFLSSLTEPCPGFHANAFAAGIADRRLCTFPEHRVPARVYHDASVAWRAPWNAVVRIGGRNVFSQSPPFMTTPFQHSFDHAYDVPGAFWFASYRQGM